MNSLVMVTIVALGMFSILLCWLFGVVLNKFERFEESLNALVAAKPRSKKKKTRAESEEAKNDKN